MLKKLTLQRDGGWVNADVADKGGGGVGEMRTLADKGGRMGVWTSLFWLT